MISCLKNHIQNLTARNSNYLDRINKKKQPITEKTLFEQAKHMTKSKTNE